MVAQVAQEHQVQVVHQELVVLMVAQVAQEHLVQVVLQELQVQAVLQELAV